MCKKSSRWHEICIYSGNLVVQLVRNTTIDVEVAGSIPADITSFLDFTQLHKMLSADAAVEEEEILSFTHTAQTEVPFYDQQALKDADELPLIWQYSGETLEQREKRRQEIASKAFFTHYKQQCWKVWHTMTTGEQWCVRPERANCVDITLRQPIQQKPQTTKQTTNNVDATNEKFSFEEWNARAEQLADAQFIWMQRVMA